MCLLLELTGLNRFVGASYGTQQQVNRRVEEAIVAYRHEESARLAHAMPAKDITLTQDETFTGGLCLVGIEPVSNYIVLEQAAQARDHDTWQALMEQALAGLNCRVIQSTSDEAPGLLAYVEHHLGAHHSPDLFHVQHELSKAVAAPMAVKQRAAAQGRREGGRDAQAGARAPRPTPTASLQSVVQAVPQRRQRAWSRSRRHVEAARHEHQRLTGQREQVTQSIRAIGHAYHFVDLERGVRRNGKLIAGDIQRHIDTIRTIAQQEDLSETCLERLEKAERVVPKMQATIEFVSGYVRQQVRQLDVGTAAVLRHACASHSVVLPRPCGLDADGDRGRATSCAGRAPPHPTV